MSWDLKPSSAGPLRLSTTRGKPRKRGRGLGKAAKLGLLYAALVGLLLLGYWWRSKLGSELPKSARRQPRAWLSPRTPSQPPRNCSHSFLLLQGETALLQADLPVERYAPHPHDFQFTEVDRRAALVLARQFDLVPANLPAVVYIPPWCWHGRQHHTFRPEAVGGLAGFERWARGVMRERVVLANDAASDVCFNWLSPEGNEVQVVCLPPNGRNQQYAHVFDSFVARDAATRAMLGMHTVIQEGIFPVRAPRACNYMAAPDTCRLEPPPMPTDPQVLRNREANEATRLALMRDQPAAAPRFTPTGWAKAAAPPDALAVMREFWAANRNAAYVEAWPPEHTYTNQFEVPNLMVSFPEGSESRGIMFGAVQAAAEAWAGVKLAPSALYGIRVYTRGSTLANHVDRKDTHVVSAIINVAQDVEAPWPLLLVEHSGRELQLEVAPGEMVLYEGAACVHGRETPLRGRYFANVFVHFQPITAPGGS